MQFTRKDKEKIKELLKTYSKKQLKEFWVKCFGERALLICSTDFKAQDGLNLQRKEMLETLAELQEEAGKRMKEAV